MKGAFYLSSPVLSSLSGTCFTTWEFGKVENLVRGVKLRGVGKGLLQLAVKWPVYSLARSFMAVLLV